MSLTSALHAAVTGRVPAGRVAVVRVLIGLAALLRLPDAMRLLERLFLLPTMRTPYVAWAPDLPVGGARALLALWAVAALCFTVGWRTRTAGTALCAVLAAVIVLDQQSYSNHLYLLALVVGLLVLADAGAALSVDARARRGRAWVPGWPVTLLKLQVSIVYAFAALAKINAEYLSGTTLALSAGAGALRLVPEPGSWSAVGGALLSIALEAFLAVALWMPRWRGVAFAAGAALHAAMIVLLPGAVRWQLVVFAIEMGALYLLFPDHDPWVAARRWWERRRGLRAC
jgi:hypothetical protein